MTRSRWQRTALDRRAEVLDPAVVGLFDDVFVRSCDLYEEYVDRLAQGVLVALGGDDLNRRGTSVNEIVRLRDLVPERAAVALDWIVRRLTAAGRLEPGENIEGRDGEPCFRLAAGASAADPEEIRTAQVAHDPAALPSYELAALAAQAYPAFLRGEVDGEAVLFGPDRMGLWSSYFANSNPLYAINNLVGTAACVRWAPRPLGTVLELGGGLGSGGAAVVAGLAAAERLGEVERYHFTDIAPPFLRRGQRAVAAAAGGRLAVTMGRLDMDRGFADQGVGAGSCGLVFAVNTVHVAADLGFTLREVHAALRPGGVAVLAECLRPLPDDPVYPELIFNLLEAFRSPQLDRETRTRGGFLTPEQWLGACRAAGFEAVELLPDVIRLRELYPSFVVGAIVAHRSS